MSSEWRKVSISEVATIVGGGTPSTKDASFWDGNIPWLTPKDLSSHHGMYVMRGERSITAAGLAGSSAKIVPPDTVLFTSRAPIGYVAIAGQAIATNQGFKSLVLKDGHDSRYFYYLLRHYTPELEAIATGSTFLEISGRVLGKFEVAIPSQTEQKRIAGILSALDDRIALLRETNATLEAIAQAMFKSWFVDFDPVHAKHVLSKAEGQQGRAPEGMSEATPARSTPEGAPDVPPDPSAAAALFPDSFEESELGLVPRGWKIRKAETLLTRLSTKVRYTKEQVSSSGATPVYEQGAGILLGYHDSPAQFPASSDEPIFIFGDHTCVTHLSCEPFDISMNVIPLKGSDRSTLWTYYAIKDKQTFQEYRRHWMELAIKEIVVAPKEICDQFSLIASSLHVKMESNTWQANTLATLRDTLLPRLISGQLRLPEAKENHA